MLETLNTQITITFTQLICANIIGCMISQILIELVNTLERKVNEKKEKSKQKQKS